MYKNTYIVAGALLVSVVNASASIEIATSYVGDAGNPADTDVGAVSYSYYVGTYEVTNSQYVEFLNAKASVSDSNGLFNPEMSENEGLRLGGINRAGSGGAYSYSVYEASGISAGDRPVNYVSFFDAARFANWLTNGQGDGDTETGVYDLTAETVTRDSTAWDNGGVAIASEDEWYKAAYYDPALNNGDGGYWDYAHQSDSLDADDANYANANGRAVDVGTYEASAYGTFDQGGNLWEWNDAVSDGKRNVRGGGYAPSDVSDPAGDLSRTYEFYSDASAELSALGFRVSSLSPIPEPSAFAAIFGSLTFSFAIMRRNRRRIYKK